MKNVLIISQAIWQDYIDMLREACGVDSRITVVTGSQIIAECVVKSPEHSHDSIRSRLSGWMAHYLFLKKWARENRNNQYDLIICTSNPPINAYLGLKLKRRFRTKFIYIYWDLYPQVIETLMSGFLSKIVSFFWHDWNDRYFKRIDQIVTIGEYVKQSIQKPISYGLKIEVLPLPIDTGLISPIEKEKNPFIEKNHLQNKFIVLYSGKMGRGHNIELILESAKKLKDRTDILFVFIGQGEKWVLVEEYMRQGYPNLRLFPWQPSDMMPYSIACGDIGIVSQEAKSAQNFLPSKVYSMMAAGEAIIGICSAHDDLQKVIDDNEIGIAVKDNSLSKLCDAIEMLCDNKELLWSYKKKARETAERLYSKAVITEMYRDLFEKYLGEE